jgi:hypothetical protein
MPSDGPNELPKQYQNEFGGIEEFLGDDWGDIDFSDFDYADIYDDVGEEEEDSYSEDAG